MIVVLLLYFFIQIHSFVCNIDAYDHDKQCYHYKSDLNQNCSQFCNKNYSTSTCDESKTHYYNTTGEDCKRLMLLLNQPEKVYNNQCYHNRDQNIEYCNQNQNKLCACSYPCSVFDQSNIINNNFNLDQTNRQNSSDCKKTIKYGEFCHISCVNLQKKFKVQCYGRDRYQLDDQLDSCHSNTITKLNLLNITNPQQILINLNLEFDGNLSIIFTNTKQASQIEISSFNEIQSLVKNNIISSNCIVNDLDYKKESNYIFISPLLTNQYESFSFDNQYESVDDSIKCNEFIEGNNLEMILLAYKDIKSQGQLVHRINFTIPTNNCPKSVQGQYGYYFNGNCLQISEFNQSCNNFCHNNLFNSSCINDQIFNTDQSEIINNCLNILHKIGLNFENNLTAINELNQNGCYINFEDQELKQYESINESSCNFKPSISKDRQICNCKFDCKNPDEKFLGGKCIKQIVQNCLEFTTGQCSKCFDNQKLINGQCVELDHCVRMGKLFCEVCEQGYMLGIDKKCNPEIFNCVSYLNSVCILCEKNQQLDSDSQCVQLQKYSSPNLSATNFIAEQQMQIIVIIIITIILNVVCLQFIFFKTTDYSVSDIEMDNINQIDPHKELNLDIDEDINKLVLEMDENYNNSYAEKIGLPQEGSTKKLIQPKKRSGTMF